ncbi:unnamed protein product [Brachionus calyciflorus]|uniref:KIND domain-containing protein n=1 Tax=Brachionus calyciflorus TaxID=104777 RepID=A0A813M9B9_9BILA|nr:unnamed protein product [Brachionus calyciflorus]
MSKIDGNLPIELIENVTEDDDDEEEEDEDDEEEKENLNETKSMAYSVHDNSKNLSLIEIKMKNSNELLNFQEILQLFNTAISEEQAWAVLYQVLVEFRTHLDTNLELVKQNLNQIDIYLLNFAKDGSISFDFSHKNLIQSTKNHQEIEQERVFVESKVLTSVAYLIFDALDYGNNQLNEPNLQSSLSNLLIFISGHCKEFGQKGLSEDDEGYDPDEEETNPTIEKAIEICQNNVNEPEYHYKAVCRGLYAQAYELKAFLAKIEDSKKTIQDSGKDPAKYCFEILDKTDWAKIWMQVITELRHGIKLRKVVELPQTRRHIEYELTPFEILLDRIRAKQYHLKKVSLDASLAPEIKKSARDIILEFIRSRPPLRKSSLRSLNTSRSFSFKQQPPNLHEQLMNSIRNYSTPLRKIQIEEKKSTRSIGETSFKDESKIEVKQNRRLLKADKKLLNNLTSSDTDESEIDDDDLKNLPILQEEEDEFKKNLMNNLFSQVRPSPNKNSKKRIKAPDCLRSPLAPWRDPDENWKAYITDDMLADQKTCQLNRRHTMNLADFNRITSSISAFNIFSRTSFNESKTKQDNLQKTKMSHSNSFNKHNTKKLTSSKPTECVRLTFEELCHIRSVLTKADLDYLLFDNKIYYDVSRGKVCFSCRKTRFHLFNWGAKCRICQQKICKKCLRSAQLKNGHLVKVPVDKLCPERISQSKNDSASNSSDNEDYEVISNTNDDSLEYNQVDESSCDSISVNSFNMNQIIEICTDCYQIMDGFVVSANETELGLDQNKNSPIFTRKKDNHIDLIKSVHLANKKSLNTHSDLSPAVSSSSSIGMDNLPEIVITHGESSPVPSKYMMSHHSTPTISNSNTPAIINSSLNEKSNDLSTIIAQSNNNTNNFGEFDSFNQNNASLENVPNNLRHSLTLDLQPVCISTN